MRGATRYNILLLSSYLSRIGRIENPSFSASRHPSQDTSHLILHCPATDSLRRLLFGDCLSTTSGPCHGDLPGFWASMVFRHAPIPWKELGSDNSNNTSRTSIFFFFVPPLQVALTNFACLLKSGPVLFRFYDWSVMQSLRFPSASEESANIYTLIFSPSYWRLFLLDAFLFGTIPCTACFCSGYLFWTKCGSFPSCTSHNPVVWTED